MAGQLSPLPIIVLAGSDPQAGTVPPGLKPDDMLQGHKGIRPFRWGRCLAAEMIHRVRLSHCFQEPILVGPRRTFSEHVDCEIVNVEGDLVNTLQRVVTTLGQRFDPHDPVAFSSCDILPSPEQLRQLLEESYLPHQPSMFWTQLVEAQPEQMGASWWKPSYRLLPRPGQPLRRYYPGHLIIARPESLRFRLTNHLLQLAYRYRNRRLHQRYLGLTLRAIGALVREDLSNLASLQLPILTVLIPWRGLRAYFRQRRGQLTVNGLERAVATAFLHRGFQHYHHDRPVVFSATSCVAFAKDIDTVGEFEEADQAGPYEASM